MAKIDISVDTEKALIDVSVDGKKLPNIGSLNIYKYPSYRDKDVELVDFSCTSFEKDDGGLMKNVMWALRGGDTDATAQENGIVGSESAIASLVCFNDDPHLMEDVKKFLKGLNNDSGI